jgi:predicted nucleic acid-binding protein
LECIYDIVQRRIIFINNQLIPAQTSILAKQLTKDIDQNDEDFVALTLYMKATLWTGDKVLYNGLIKKDFKLLINTAELQKQIK